VGGELKSSPREVEMTCHGMLRRVWLLLIEYSDHTWRDVAAATTRSCAVAPCYLLCISRPEPSGTGCGSPKPSLI